jgi:hypothetical protein
VARIESERARAQVERILGYVAGGVAGVAVLASIDGRVLATAGTSATLPAPEAIAKVAARMGPEPGIQVHWVARDAALVVASSPVIACGLVHERTQRAVELLRRMIVPPAPDAPIGGGGGAPANAVLYAGYGAPFRRWS